MQKIYINMKQNFYFCKNKIVDFIEHWPFYFNKIKEFCIYIISFFQTQFQNLIALKNIKLELGHIFESIQLVLNGSIALIALIVIFIVIIYFSFFLDILKFLLKLIIFIIWKIPKSLVKNLMITLFSLMKWLIQNRKNFVKKPQLTPIREKTIIENSNNEEIKNLIRKIEIQNQLIEKILIKQANKKIIKKPKINKKTNLKEVKK